ncbi:hypothetical protein N1F78_06685 [Seonamhaeicola sp. MEBiC1930]|uniref:hypothetical protein n=1 Tax=Seonamhaeicola sp. MEBiC01930 TaxID=2976768 RepID=UPI0032439C63
MKNVLNNTKKGILMVAMLATVMSFANEIDGRDFKVTALTINNVKEGNLLSIKDINGSIIYTETIEQSGSYTKGFDLTELPDGKYFFELIKDIEIKTIPFTVKSNIATFNKEKETIIFKPFVKTDNDLVYITKLAPELEPLKINVYGLYSGGASELLFTETIKGKENIERVLKLDKGDYKIVFHSNNKTYTKYINN